MALDQHALLELTEALRSADTGSLMRTLLGTILQALVDAEATAKIGAEPHQRVDTRTTQRNGTRDKTVSTTAEDLTVKIPKLRAGSFFPSLLEPRRRIDVACTPSSCRPTSRASLPARSTTWSTPSALIPGSAAARSPGSAASSTKTSPPGAPDRWTPKRFRTCSKDATYCKARVGGRVVSRAVVIATGVSADGRREVLGCDVGDSETEVFWTEFLRGLRDRGLDGVQLVISDQHRGLTNAVAAVMHGAAWQRCRVHFMRNALARVSKGHAQMVAAAIRTIFAQPTAETVRDAVDDVACTLEGKFPAVAQLLRDAKADLTAFADFPHLHWVKVWSTNPLVIWSLPEGVVDVRDGAVRCRDLPAGRGYLLRSSTQILGRFDVRSTGDGGRAAA